MDGRIFSLESQVEAKLKHQWTVDEMAKSLGISPAHFHKIFKASLGVSPNVWLRRLRLDRARDLIETTFEQIQQIAIESVFKIMQDSLATLGASLASVRLRTENDIGTRNNSPPPPIMTTVNERFHQPFSLLS